MNLVESWEDVLANIRTLEEARASKDHHLHKAYVALMKQGTCFVAYRCEAGVAFAPSKFIGYMGNDISSHIEARSERDGRDTNKAIDEILDRSPEVNPSAESAYRKFCQSLNVEPSKAGTFGVARKFWVTDDAIDAIESAAIDAIRDDPALTKTEKDQLIKARLGQGQFRKDLITLWGGCCLTGCTAVALLRASHIKPWSVSDNRERLDRFNGLLLSPNADALFDRGYVTFSADGDLIVSSKLSELNARYLLAGCERVIKVHERNRSYLEYHRKNIFRGGTVQLN